MSARIVKVYAQAFTGERARVHGMLVDEGGQLRVWDEIAGHFTVCHSLHVKQIVAEYQHLLDSPEYV
jgi:hypothetical protein